MHPYKGYQNLAKLNEKYVWESRLFIILRHSGSHCSALINRSPSLIGSGPLAPFITSVSNNRPGHIVLSRTSSTHIPGRQSGLLSTPAQRVPDLQTQRPVRRQLVCPNEAGETWWHALHFTPHLIVLTRRPILVLWWLIFPARGNGGVIKGYDTAN